MKQPETFEDAVALALEILTEAGKDTALILKEKPPKVRRENLINGDVRLVCVWPDGDETSECIVHRIDHQQSISE